MGFLKDVYVVHAKIPAKRNVKIRGSRKAESWGRVSNVARRLSRVRVMRSPRQEASGGEILSARNEGRSCEDNLKSNIVEIQEVTYQDLSENDDTAE